MKNSRWSNEEMELQGKICKRKGFEETLAVGLQDYKRTWVYRARPVDCTRPTGNIKPKTLGGGRTRSLGEIIYIYICLHH